MREKSGRGVSVAFEAGALALALTLAAEVRSLTRIPGRRGRALPRLRA